jgi:molecular chaperone GrpE (heat shock protein)
MTNDPEEDQESSAAGTSNPCVPSAPPSVEPPNGAKQVLSHPAGTPPSSELEALRQDVIAIRELVDKRLSRDEVKEEAFDRLYEELDRLKRHTAILDNQSLYIDLILLYDRMNAACENAAREPGHVAFSLREELREILLRRDLHLIPTGNDFFDPRTQRAISTEATVSSEEDGKVLRVIREGFSCGELVIRPQEVVVARFRPPTPKDQPGDLSTKDKEES